MNKEQIIFKDFPQQTIQGPTIYASHEETPSEVLTRVNTWLEQQDGTVINMETLYFGKQFVLRVWLRS